MNRGAALGPAQARWRIEKNVVEGKPTLSLFYENLRSAGSVLCGTVPGDVDEVDVVLWISSFGSPATGDEIQFADGNRARWTRSGLLLSEVRLDDGRVISIGTAATA